MWIDGGVRGGEGEAGRRNRVAAMYLCVFVYVLVMCACGVLRLNTCNGTVRLM